MHLDNNGTTFLLPEVRQRIAEFIAQPVGNPASQTAEGRAAAAAVEDARHKVAALIAAQPEQIAFVSSGSEANVAVIRSAIAAGTRRRLVIGALEHSSLSALADQLEAEGIEVARVPALPSGQIDLTVLRQLVNGQTAVVSLQAVNNETGIVQPYTAARQIAHAVGALFHSDIAQAVGKVPPDPEWLRCDYLTFTAHKFHGPQGIGAMWSQDSWKGFRPLITGGTQEFGIRGGTHPTIAIVGMGEAARLRTERLEPVIRAMTHLRDSLERQLEHSGVVFQINGDASLRVGNTSNLRFEGIDGHALYLRLLHDDIACAQRSACTSGYPEPSHILRAMGLDYYQAFSSIRFSFSELNTEEEVRTAVETIAHHYRELSGRIPAPASRGRPPAPNLPRPRRGRISASGLARGASTRPKRWCDAACAICSIVPTAKMKGLKPLHYLHYLISRAPFRMIRVRENLHS